jgi:Tol biopolymer transport system component
MRSPVAEVLQVKKTDISKYSAWLVAAAAVLALAACSEDKNPDDTTGGGSTGPITLQSIIVDPRAATAGDTLVLTAVVTSSAQNEDDFPVYEWSKDGGTLVETDKQSVRWVAPATSGTYTVTARATNDVNSATTKTIIYVGDAQNIIPAQAGAVDLIGIGPDFYYLSSPDVTAGADVSKFVGGVSSDAQPPDRSNGLNVIFSPDGNAEAHSADSVTVGATVQTRNIYVGDFGSGTFTRITTDGAKPGEQLRNVCDFPSFSPNGQVVAYQRWAQKYLTALPDSFHVYIFDRIAHKRTLVTYQWANPRGFFPTFSTDGKWLVYVLDTNRSAQYELYGSPMTGNDVDGSIASAVRMTDTGGAITSGDPPAVKRPLMQWNPVSPVLAIVAADNVLYLVQTTSTGSVVASVPEVPKPAELTWSDDGTMLAASYSVTTGGDAHATVATITPSGAVTVRVTAVAGDAVRDMAFSPDGKWMLYRVSRGGGSWFEVVDIGAGKLSAPLAVTAVEAVGDAGAYRGLMSLQPVWTSSNLMIYPTFGTSSDGTAGVSSRSLSGL